MTEPFAYALIRVVPRIERGECVNAGVVLFCRRLRYLAARVRLDEECVRLLDPGADLDAVRRHLVAVEAIAAGHPGAGPMAALDQPARFHWLTAPASTILQAGPVHTGITDDPAASLDRLFAALVERPGTAAVG